MYFVFQEQLRRRREEEERIAQQNEFLRASLRGSRKLQALQDNHPLASEQQRPPIGIDNDAFIADEDVERILGKCISYAHSQPQNHENACAIIHFVSFVTKSQLKNLQKKTNPFSLFALHWF